VQPISDPPSSRPRLDRGAVAAAWGGLGIGSLALLGWVVRVPALTRLGPEWTSMRITTALGLVLLGAALAQMLEGGALPLRRKAALFAAGLVAAAGLWSLGEHLSGAHFSLEGSITRLIARADVGASRRPSVVTALSLVLTGLGLLGLRRPGALGRLSQLCAALVGLTALLVLSAYAYGEVALHTVAPLSQIAAPSALGFLLLAGGVLLAWGDAGPLRVVAGNGLGSVLGRRALPLAIALPLLAGWLSLNGDRMGLFHIEFAMALVALINTAIFAALIFAGGAWLNRVDAQRAASEADVERSERHFRALAESLPQFVWTCDAGGACDYLSPQWVEYTGVPERDQLGSAWLNQIHPDDRDYTIASWNSAAVEAGVFDVEFRIRRHDGVYRWFKTRATPLRNEKGRVVKWFGSNTDIQDLRDARDVLQQLNQSLERRVEERTEEVLAGHRALEAVTRQLAAAQRLNKVGSWELDVASGTLQWSDELYRLLQLQPGSGPIRGEHFRQSFPSDDWDKVLRAFEQCLATGESYELELVMHLPDGTRAFIIARGEPTLDASGKVAQVIGTLQDVTALKRTERELSRALERVRLATGAANMGIWDWDVSDDVLVWDEAMYPLYGVAPGEFDDAFSAWRACVHPEDLPEFERDLLRTLAGGHEFEMSFRILRAGQVRYLRGSAVAHRDAEGRALRVVGINIDVTAQRAAETALRANEALLREFVKHAPAAIAMLDRDVRYLQASDRWLMDYRLDDTNIIGRSHYDVFPDVPQRWRDVHQRVLRGSIEKCDEDPFPRADGRIEWLQWESRPWRLGDGSIGGLIFFTQVVTARKEMELELRNRRAELERSNQDLEQFAYVASHDLQEPLRAVAGCGQILQRRYGHQLEPMAGELIQHMVEGAARMQALILDLLAFSRVGARGHELVAIDSGEALKRALKQLEGAVNDSHAQVEVASMPRVKGDVEQLTQLFQNLMGNAIKYRGSGPVKIAIAAQSNGNAWQFSVRDNGIGIEPQYFEKIFVLFQRLHTREEYPGTGIGLAICKKIVERHGGRIWVESTPGQGTAFHFTLPRGEA
jgi:PAS domain S-box-containing protein